MRSNFLSFSISLLTGLLLLYAGLRAYSFSEVQKALARAETGYLAAAVAALAVAYIFRAVRWTIWEKGLGLWNSLRLILIGFMGNNLLPARGGEFLRAICAKRKTPPGKGGVAALASIAIERALDGLLLSILGAAAIAGLPRHGGYHAVLLATPILFGGIMAGIFVGIWRHDLIRRLLDRLHSIFPGHLTRFGREKAGFFLDGLQPICSRPRAAGAAAGTLLVWGTEWLVFFLVARAVAPGTPASTCLLFLAAVNFAALFPLTIGGLGAVEALAPALLVRAGVSPGNAVAMVLLQHGFQYAFTTLGGLWAYFHGGFYRLPKRSGERKPAGEEARAAECGTLADSHRRVCALSRDLDLATPTVTDPYLSIVIPGFNEQNRLPRTVLQTLEWCAEAGALDRFELLIVDDGSDDETLTLAQLFSRQVGNVRSIACPHRGKGEAVRMGMLNAAGSFILFMDADGATPLAEIPKLLETLKDGADIAIGSRVVQDPRETSVVTSWKRKLTGRIFSGIVNLLVIPGIADTQCGFKMFRREVVRDIFSRQKIEGFAFDVEILFLARKLGFSVAEVPVNWVNQEGSKVRLVTDSVRMFLDIARIHWLHRGERFIPFGARD
jgi:dolichyl-phosphate beta-glucosyltransferase